MSFEITCLCGEKLTLTESTEYVGNDSDTRFVAYCTKCHRVWDLTDSTETYEEMVMNEITDPQHGEYKKDDVWYYKDGKSME